MLLRRASWTAILTAALLGSVVCTRTAVIRKEQSRDHPVCAQPGEWSASVPVPPAAVSREPFDESFSAFGLDAFVTGGRLTCTKNPGGSDTKEGQVEFLQPTAKRWGFLASTDYTELSGLSWRGDGPATGAWRLGGTSPPFLYFHAENTVTADRTANSNDGFGFISRLSFDKTSLLAAEALLSMDACVAHAGGAGNSASGPPCMVGMTLGAGESSYREMSLLVDRVGSQTATLARFAPCDWAPFYNEAHEIVTVPLGTAIRVRLEYGGDDGRGWRYSLDDHPLYLKINGKYEAEEPYAYLQGDLAGNPHFGLYMTASDNGAAPLSGGNSVEGRLGSVKVRSAIVPAAVRASSSYQNLCPEFAVDRAAGTAWSSGEYATPDAPQWIELYLDTPRTVRRVRLLTNQTRAGVTTHKILMGMSPNPSHPAAILNSFTSDSQWLVIDIAAESAVAAQYIRIATTSSPSRVGWREVVISE